MVIAGHKPKPTPYMLYILARETVNRSTYSEYMARGLMVL